MDDGRDLPARLDRSALERVLARAAELQAGELDPGEYVAEDRLLEIAKDVGKDSGAEADYALIRGIEH